MDYTQLGRSGLRVSRLCLGTMSFGSATSEPDSHQVMDRALEHGINFFDTANIYGPESGRGVTEEIIGNWLSQGGGRRERTVLATKVFGDMSPWPNDGGLSAMSLRRACDASLQRLKTDHIDLYQMHHVDRRTPWEEIWEAMEILRQQGKILYVGSSNFAGWHLTQAQSVALRRNQLGLISEQSIYNLLERTVELEVLPAALDHGIGIIPWSPLNGGLLGGILQKNRRAVPSRTGRAAQILRTRRQAIESYESLCSTLGEHPAGVGLAWLLRQKAVSAPIIGPRTVAQLDTSVQATRINLDAETLARLDTIFPGPGTAPEAYAW